MKLWMVLALSAMVLISCGNRNKKEDAWVAPEHETETRQLPDLQVKDSVRMGGKQYVYDILRTPSDSLDKVKDDMEDLYLDNTIRLTIRRDGAVFFDRTFTKATFAASIDKSFYQNAILDGIRFIKAEPGQGLIFSFAVSYPDSDMSVPFLMTIADGGSYTFVKDENLDHEEGDSAFFADDDGV